MLDADEAPGGAWQHRWDSLTMHDVHGIAALPDADAAAEQTGRANEVVPAYFADYERAHHLPVLRPVRVDQVVEADDGLLEVRAGDRRWLTRTIVNATGTWSRPFVPALPGRGDVPRRAAAHPRLPRPGAVPRSASGRRGRRRVRRAAARRDRPGRRGHALGDPARAGLAHRRLHSRGRAGRRWRWSRSGYAAGCRRPAS